MNNAPIISLAALCCVLVVFGMPLGGSGVVGKAILMVVIAAALIAPAVADKFYAHGQKRAAGGRDQWHLLTAVLILILTILFADAWVADANSHAFRLLARFFWLSKNELARDIFISLIAVQVAWFAVRAQRESRRQSANAPPAASPDTN